MELIMKYLIQLSNKKLKPTIIIIKNYKYQGLIAGI